jgi:hypothetical protein
MKDVTFDVADKLRDNTLMRTAPDLDYREIPVSASGERILYSKISTEDYDRVMAISDKWRLTTSGYAFHTSKIENVAETTYLHVFIHGKSAKHVNNDRLDNRRENLIDSSRGPPAKRVKTEEDLFVLHTPRVVCEDMYKFSSTDADLKRYTGFGQIEYDNDKFYSGEIKAGKPHGYGHLFEGNLSTQSCGNWSNGSMMTGMVLTFKRLPARMCCEGLKYCPNREIDRLDVVKHGYRQ